VLIERIQTLLSLQSLALITPLKLLTVQYSAKWAPSRPSLHSAPMTAPRDKAAKPWNEAKGFLTNVSQANWKAASFMRR
jgi:hypothetical protein